MFFSYHIWLPYVFGSVRSCCVLGISAFCDYFNLSQGCSGKFCILISAVATFPKRIDEYVSIYSTVCMLLPLFNFISINESSVWATVFLFIVISILESCIFGCNHVCVTSQWVEVDPPYLYFFFNGKVVFHPCIKFLPKVVSKFCLVKNLFFPPEPFYSTRRVRHQKVDIIGDQKSVTLLC